MKYWLTRSELDIPSPSKLPYDENDCNFSYYFVGGETFSLSSYFMRPYLRRHLNIVQRVFNHRLSRDRKTIGCKFGKMTEKYQVLSTSICCHDADRVNDIIKSCCVLYFYLKKRRNSIYSTTGTNAEKHFGGVLTRYE
jgi:hypothetical protein